MSTNVEPSSGTDSKCSRRKSVRKCTGKIKKSVSIIISSEDADDEQDFMLTDLRDMGTTGVGALGLDCLSNVERMRSKSKNLNGGISGKMRRDIERAKNVINTLILKVAEVTGDPSILSPKSKELEAQIEKHKLVEVLRKRELEETKLLVEALRKEVTKLKGKLNGMEEERKREKKESRVRRMDRNEDLLAEKKEQISMNRNKDILTLQLVQL